MNMQANPYRGGITRAREGTLYPSFMTRCEPTRTRSRIPGRGRVTPRLAGRDPGLAPGERSAPGPEVKKR